MHADALNRFSPAARAWFSTSFAAPTTAQAGAWASIASGQHTLVVAPTGSGKTLSAFLWSIDRLACEPTPDEALRRCRVLYVSPLKALAVDVERNLRSPLVGIDHAAARLGLPRPDITVAVRSGDTPADERRRFAKAPSDILITTPESLYLLLTSQAREALRGVQTVIIDEIHAVAATKRGAHLATSLDRLDALLDAPAQRVGLSATVRPVEEVARFLAGGRPTTIVAPETTKAWDLSVVVPVPDLASLGQEAEASGPGAGDPRRASVWPHVESSIVDLIEQHRSTLVFANSRRLAERLTGRLNEIEAERLAEAPAPDEVRSDTGLEPVSDAVAAALPERESARHAPAEVMGQAGSSGGADAVIARAHHGSVSHEQRKQVEEELKAGRLPAVVATSSLELGIDMGAVDLVVQVEAPPSVASGLQRVGRAGHQVGAVSHGVFFPKYRGDLVSSAVIVERMRAGAIEALSVPANPLDVLAQQIVAMVALDDWTVDDLFDLVRRSAPFAGLTRPVLESVLDMLAGRYPAEGFAELRPRLNWDRASGVLSARRGSQRVAITSGGTIPDRGLFGVFIAGEGPGRRVGELDEEMVYESRVGDTITLGTSTWRIEDITHDQVLVTPAPGQPGRLPFWRGDSLGRPAELGAAQGAFVREIASLDAAAARSRLRGAGLDEWASDNLIAYLEEQREAARLPTDRQIVVERFTDELGDWRVVIHSPYGAPVHAPWALAIGARLRERYGVDVQAMHADDGIVLRLPDLGDPWGDGMDDWGAGWASGGAGADEPSGLFGVERGSDRAKARPGVLNSDLNDGSAPSQPQGDPLANLLDDLLIDPDEIADLVTEQVGGSALFASRFRECAGRALLLPNKRPGKRQALWQQRQRSAQLLEVASQFPSFPIVLEAVRECVQDVFDVPGLTELLRRVRSREVSVVEVTTPSPSPFASSLLFGYVAQFIYEGDTPLAERRAAALSLDPDLLADLLGTSAGLSLRELLDPEALSRTHAELQHLVDGRRARDADEVTDLLRVLGPLTLDEIIARSQPGSDVTGWLEALTASGRVFAAQLGTRAAYVGIEDAGRLRDALGVPLPPGVPDAFAAPTTDPLGDLLVRFARTHLPFTPEEAAAWLGLGRAIVADALRRLAGDGRVVEGEFRPDAATREFCDPGVLRTIRRRSVAALRAEVEPVPQPDYGRFLPTWQGVGGSLRGVDGVLRAVEQLAGVPLPASALESLVLPARLRDYTPALLDELCASGEVVWRGHGALAKGDGWVSLYPADLVDLAPEPGVPDGELEAALLAAMNDGGAYFFAALAAAAPTASETALADALWSLVWKGLVTGDTLAPLRAHLGSGATTHRVRSATPRGRYGRLRASVPRRPSPPTAVGRWSLLGGGELSATERAFVRSEVLLDRYGVLTRGSVAAEEVEGGFTGVYRLLSAAEEAGRVRRGYFVEGLGAAQFATVGAIDRLRATGGRDNQLPTTGGPHDQLRAAARVGGGFPAHGSSGGVVGRGLLHDSHGRGPAGPGAARPASDGLVVLAACDPANPYGAALPWPETAVEQTHKPARKAGAVVVLASGEPVVYLERGGRSALTWSSDPDALAAATHALADLVHSGRLASLSIEKIDGGAALGSTAALASALLNAGFTMTPKGLRLRR